MALAPVELCTERLQHSRSAEQRPTAHLDTSRAKELQQAKTVQAAGWLSPALCQSSRLDSKSTQQLPSSDLLPAAKHRPSLQASSHQCLQQQQQQQQAISQQHATTQHLREAKSGQLQFAHHQKGPKTAQCQSQRPPAAQLAPCAPSGSSSADATLLVHSQSRFSFWDSLASGDECSELSNSLYACPAHRRREVSSSSERSCLTLSQQALTQSSSSAAIGPQDFDLAAGNTRGGGQTAATEDCVSQQFCMTVCDAPSNEPNSHCPHGDPLAPHQQQQLQTLNSSSSNNNTLAQTSGKGTNQSYLPVQHAGPFVARKR